MIANHGGAQPPKKAQVTVYDELFNETTVEVDKDATGTALASAAGTPSTTLLLQQLKSGGLQRVGMDEVLQLEHGNTFFLLSGERTFTFTVDRHSFEWPVAQVTASFILRMAGAIDSGVDLVQQAAGLPDQVLDSNDPVTFTGAGETFVTKPATKTVTVFYGPDEVPFELERRKYKTEELLEKFKVEPGYVLDAIFHNQFTPLKPGAEIRVKEGMRFTSHPPVGQSS